ncbi:hypothetical protein [Tengunoibacter tsumagoiensis]|uniref:Uncharacterized protein n=1 Tax=Tengunoibacter tsumagoiensis TaxID=2014871 RepID=A0A402A5D7_9CHLR|nr:hypothetical protein [Tengunoibacter tsumagoiensis]GCE14177.1 hypothetical protein KTT_40360 [Tengunoibacter tsumagoiensis]GCE14231.1 hypothetical protein KTT_40900 [Tengunoibacter tsumagoiensis]
MNHNQSEVARIRAQIEAELSGAKQGLEGFAETAKHRFITERMAAGCNEIAEVVGAQEARRIVCEIMEKIG